MSNGAPAAATVDGLFRQLADGLPQGLLVHRGGLPLYANLAAARAFGFAGPDALIAAGTQETLIPAIGPGWQSDTTATRRVTAKRRDGTPILIDLRAGTVEWADGGAEALTITDVTQRETSDAVLRDSEAGYRRLFENIPDGVFRITEDRQLLEGNPALVDMLGFDSLDELRTALTQPDHCTFVDPDGWDSLVAELKNSGRVRDQQAQWRCRNGEAIWVMLNMTVAPGAGGSELVFEGSAVEITEQRDAQLSLIHAKEAAELANRAKSEFLAHMSHELRTPLNCVIGFSQILMNEMFGPLGRDSYREYAHDINTASNHLLGLISDILDISKIEAGELEIFDAPVDVGGLLVNCLTMMRDRADAAGITVGVEFDHDLPELLADELRLKQIVLNLLSNAVKFTPAAGRVRVSAFVGDDGGMVIEVADTGVGIAPENLERVMAPFEQVRSATTLTHEGTGLGLYLAKTLAEMHDGRIEIESELGKGTTVSVRLPPSRTLDAPENSGRRQTARQAVD
jgi:PAS domain S-box-containing protein